MSRKFWTEEEVHYLETYWGHRSIQNIAKFLDRSPDAVSTKAYKLGLGNVKGSIDGLTLIELPEILGVPYNSIRRTWRDAGLRVRKCGKNIAYVKEKDLHKFMRENTHLWDARKCDYYYFHNQKWFLEILENERNGNHADRYHRWSEQEKARFIYMREQKGMYFREIAEVFGISEKNAWRRYKCWKKQSNESA